MGWDLKRVFHNDRNERVFIQENGLPYLIKGLEYFAQRYSMGFILVLQPGFSKEIEYIVRDKSRPEDHL